MAAKVKLKVDQGSTWRYYLRYMPGGEPADFTGFSARMQIRPELESTTVTAELTTANGGIAFLTAAQMLAEKGIDESGWMRFSLTASQTTSISARSYVYDAEVFSGAYVKRVVEGPIEFRREVTR